MPHKVSAGGSYRLDKIFPPPVGRLAIATGATTKRRFDDAVACLRRLAERGRFDALLALKEHRLTVQQLLDADRTGRLDALLASLAPNPEAAPLWPAVEAWLGPIAERTETVKRYGVSWKQLEGAGVLRAGATVSALRELDWKALARQWTEKGRSGSDWNHLRRAVSRFLTVHLADVYHPMRRAVVAAIPRRPESERVPDLDTPAFWRVVAAAPEHVRPAYVTLVALGLRTGEYLRMRETDLHPITKSVSIPGRKTAGSAAVLQVDPELWPWVVAAVPAPVAYQWLRIHWKRALAAVGADRTLRLHDLRHLTAQVLVEAGRSEASVQTTMRHATPAMTRRYARRKDRGENAAALARALLNARSA
ncbi:MAG: tyrosine-type recombinase/integrase [Gemmatimonadales bacterium]